MERPKFTTLTHRSKKTGRGVKLVIGGVKLTTGGVKPAQGEGHIRGQTFNETATPLCLEIGIFHLSRK